MAAPSSRRDTSAKRRDAVAAPSRPTIGPAPAAALVFVASGAVLVLEILAVRLLAPYVGLTLETTTAIIGAALAGIAAGAAVGGWLADRTDGRRLLVLLLIGGGLLTLLLVPLVRVLGPGARGEGDLAALGITLIALVPPAAVLSAVTPTVARLRLHDLEASGTVVGGISAWATAGALVGTFGTGFVLVPLLPVGTAVLGIGIALVLLGGALGVRNGGLGLATGAVALLALLALSALAVATSSPCDRETSYHCARIDVDPQNPAGRTLVLDDVRHSYVDLRDPAHLEFPYTQWIAAAIDAYTPPPAPLDVVWIGGGGFTLPRWLAATRPGSRSHVLEVDGELVDLVREQLGLRTSPRLRVTAADARVALEHEPTGSADVVVGDAFGNYAVPWHLATREWTAEIERVLRPGGLYALNVIDFAPLSLLRAEAATLRERFRHVRLVTYPAADLSPGGGNGVLIASDRPLPPIPRAQPGGGVTYTEAEVASLAGGAALLRDDFAPTDQLLTSTGTVAVARE
jgi:spermidine synthase